MPDTIPGPVTEKQWEKSLSFTEELKFMLGLKEGVAKKTRGED